MARGAHSRDSRSTSSTITSSAATLSSASLAAGNSARACRLGPSRPCPVTTRKSRRPTARRTRKICSTRSRRLSTSRPSCVATSMRCSRSGSRFRPCPRRLRPRSTPRRNVSQPSPKASTRAACGPSRYPCGAVLHPEGARQRGRISSPTLMFRGYWRGQQAPQGGVPTPPLHWGEQRRFFHLVSGVPGDHGAGGVDCILGNPPYLGGQALSGTYGHAFCECMKWRYAPTA